MYDYIISLLYRTGHTYDAVELQSKNIQEPQYEIPSVDSSKPVKMQENPSYQPVS